MKKKIIALLLAAGMTFGMPAAAAEVSLEERVAALEARVAELEAMLGIQSEETELTEELPEGIEAFEESYALEIGIGMVMRAVPEEKGKVVTKLRVGTEVTVLGGSEEWLLIEYQDEKGYINRSLAESK